MPKLKSGSRRRISAWNKLLDLIYEDCITKDTRILLQCLWGGSREIGGSTPCKTNWSLQGSKADDDTTHRLARRRRASRGRKQLCVRGAVDFRPKRTASVRKDGLVWQPDMNDPAMRAPGSSVNLRKILNCFGIGLNAGREHLSGLWTFHK